MNITFHTHNGQRMEKKKNHSALVSLGVNGLNGLTISCKYLCAALNRQFPYSPLLMHIN